MALYRIVNGVQKRIPIVPGASVPKPPPSVNTFPATTVFPSTTTYPQAG